MTTTAYFSAIVEAIVLIKIPLQLFSKVITLFSVFIEVAKLLGRDVYSFARALPFDFSESELQAVKSQSNGDLQEVTLKVNLVWM